jgi:hypothetical protein
VESRPGCKDLAGAEPTFGYMYENSETHGFLHTAFGEHPESLGVMRIFPAAQGEGSVMRGEKSARDETFDRLQCHGSCPLRGYGRVVMSRK